MLVNQDDGAIKAVDGNALNQVKDFLCLRSWISFCSKDINVRIGKAWTALLKLNTIWKSNLPDDIKTDFFRETVETVLLYGSNAWTLTQALSENLGGAYTEMLRVIQNIT